ncbi:hypothetical protein EVAR_9697_1 [Eumeta japonica]|uniref:Uncharacterized protein n=1 Tax=Eumeta variegata TaxID=151549 RepID=A0A4C1YCJ3_EUMVA|nr:hypothetical protein EVAR_9697_1 [Eumeta japonica]
MLVAFDSDGGFHANPGVTAQGRVLKKKMLSARRTGEQSIRCSDTTSAPQPFALAEASYLPSIEYNATSQKIFLVMVVKELFEKILLTL